MAKIKIKDLPKNKKISREQMKNILGGTYQLIYTAMYANSGSIQYYLEVAKYNELNDFRSLQSGTTLNFPSVNKKDS
jgi:hypothetical protein